MFLTTSISRFVDFVNSVWILYNLSGMRKFRLFLSVMRVQTLNRCLIASWILSAIYRGVREIDFTIADSTEIMALPRYLFSCGTLSVLRLEGNFNISLPNIVSLPCLRTCRLESVCFSGESAKRLFRNLQALETLELRNCFVEEDVEVLNIDAPNLKRLTIYDFMDGCQFELNVPNLVYFEHTGCATNDIIGLESLKSVVDASIVFTPDSKSRDYAVVALLRAICHVRKLTLSCEVIEAFIYSGQSLPTFSNLTRLTIGPISSLASMLLQELLNNSPNLGFFSFNQWPLDKHNWLDYDQNNYLLPEHVPTSVLLNLKEVECLFFTELDYDRNLLKYFRENATNLKSMKIKSRLIPYNEEIAN